MVGCPRDIDNHEEHVTGNAHCNVFLLFYSAADKSDCEGWIAMAEHAINAIYALAENPDNVCGRILDGICSRVLGSALNKDDSPASPESDFSLGPPLAESSQRGQ